MYLDQIEEYAVRGWIDFFKGNDLLTQSQTDSINLTSGTQSYSLSKYNAIGSSFTATSGTVVSYSPFNSKSEQVSAIILSGTQSSGTTSVTYDYLPFSILTRTPNNIDEAKFHTPRLKVLWAGMADLPYKRQRKDGKSVVRKEVFMNLFLDVDNDKGGYPLKSRLGSQILNAIEAGRNQLDRQYGFENIDISIFSPETDKGALGLANDFKEENPLNVWQTTLLVSFTVYPEVKFN